MLEMGASDPTAATPGDEDEPAGPTSLGALYLYVGLQNGALLRMVVDGTSGGFSDNRMRYLGSRPVKLFKIKCQGNEAVR